MSIRHLQQYLGYIAGLNKSIAQQIVDYRKEHGRFDNRQALKNVPRLGERTFEQAAGFLRIQAGSEPLDASAVHPESYGLVEKIVAAKATTVKDIIGNTEIIRSVKLLKNLWMIKSAYLPFKMFYLNWKNQVVTHALNCTRPSSVKILLKWHS